MKNQIHYRKIEVDGMGIFYRQAGTADLPVLLLLHGFPSSSHMFRDLITDLADRYHIIAPDYPGFGQSSAPGLTEFNYTFDNLSVLIEHFVDRLQLRDIHMYIQDYGGPVGFRIAQRRPELIRALIIQNANAYLEGFGPAVEPLVSYIQDPVTHEQSARAFLTLHATQRQYLNGASNPEKISPDSYTVDQYYLDRVGNDAIQLALFRDYGSNTARYEEWQEYFRNQQPPTLVVWGSNDRMFITAGGDAYRKDLPNAQIHQIEGGHFLLEEHHREVAALIDQFIGGLV